MSSASLDGMLLSHLPHIRYLTGFTGSHGIAIVAGRRKFLITDPRYRLQGAAETPGWRVVITDKPLLEAMALGAYVRGCRTVGFEARVATHTESRTMQRLMSGVKWVPTEFLVENIAVVKDEEEIADIRSAARIADRVFGELLADLRPGLRERDIAAEITYRMRKAGADGDAFEPIVSSGPRSAMPHARAGARRVRTGEPIILDFGCRVHGYGSDITRTVFLGRMRPPFAELYHVVRDAQQRAIDAVRAGAVAGALDALARDHIVRCGYGEFFTHSTGHGIGLHVHERPRIAPGSTEILRAGSVITVEPGVYLPGKGGIRIEDDLLVTRDGARLLTHTNRAPIIL